MNKIELYEKSRHTDSGITFIDMNQSNIFPLHWHEHIELQFVLRGRMKICCSGQIITLGEHDTLVINANELHEGIEEKNCLCFKFKLHPSFFDQKHYVFNNLIHDDNVSELMTKIIELYQNTDDASAYTVKGYLFHLIGLLCKSYAVNLLPADALAQSNEKFQKMNYIATYLHSNYASRIKTETLAEMSHYTYSYFCAAFKEAFGVPLTKYLLTIRINKASTLLSTTDMNVTEIATFSGFSDANYFARAFKKETGLSPSEYRRKVGGSEKKF